MHCIAKNIELIQWTGFNNSANQAFLLCYAFLKETDAEVLHVKDLPKLEFKIKFQLLISTPWVSKN